MSIISQQSGLKIKFLLDFKEKDYSAALRRGLLQLTSFTVECPGALARSSDS